MRKEIVVYILLLIGMSAKGADANRFIEQNGLEPKQTDKVVIDAITGLMWQEAYDSSGKPWNEALKYCEGSGYGGYPDWRLPNVKELTSLVNFNKYNPASDFPYMPPNWFWSSSGYVGDTGGAWSVDFGYGLVYYNSKTDTYYVRCVRGGP